MKQPTIEKATPPYVSVSKLQKVMELLSVRSYPEISSVLFEANGFSKLDANLAINALKFLHIVDNDSKATEVMSALRLKGDARKEVFKKIVEDSYKALFETNEAPQNLASQDLANAFHAHYPHLSDRVISAAMPVFLKLCEYAGIKEEGSVRIYKQRTEKVKREPKSIMPREVNKKNNAIDAFSPADYYLQPILKGKMTIIIPEDLHLRTIDDDNLNEAWRTVLKAARKFAEEYLKDEPSDSKETEGG